MHTRRFLVAACAAFCTLGWAAPVVAVSVLNETFANDSGFTKSDAAGPASFFRDIEDANEYWGINDPAGSGDDYDGDPAPTSGEIPPYTNFSGTFLNAEDTKAHQVVAPLRLDWSNLNISGLSELAFSGLFAARGDFEGGVSDSSDFIRVQYRIDSDSAAFSNLIWLSPEASPSEPDRLRVDDNFDGIGTGTALDVAAQSFTAPIAGAGLTLDIRILMGADANEELAFDSIMVTGTDAVSGDFNLDQVVDAADFVVWRKTDLPSQDYDTWQMNFGRSASGGFGASGIADVPEPPTLLTIVLTTAVACLQLGTQRFVRTLSRRLRVSAKACSFWPGFS